MNSWKGTQRPRASTRVRTGWSAIGSTRAPSPSAVVSSAMACVSVAPSPRRCGAAQADGQVAVAEVEPHVDAELAQLVHRVEGVALQAPAALVDAVGEPERAQVGVGADVRAVGLDVVGGVGHHHELVADDVEHPAGELGAARPAGEDDDHAVRLR